MWGDIDAVTLVRQSALELAELGKLTSLEGRNPNHSPYLAWCLFVAARVLFVQAYHTSSPPETAFHDLISALEFCGIYWDLARRYAGLLSRALKRALIRVSRQAGGIEASSSETETETATQETAVAALLDFRKTSANANQVPMSGVATPALQAMDFANERGFEKNKVESFEGLLADWAGDGEANLGLYSWFEFPTAG
ncbi:hypothetical protein P7C70_g4339, partial [Phenoliferia sp. Uapishka_3]